MKHRIVPYTEEEKRSVLKYWDYTEESLKEDIDGIMDWFQKQPHLEDAVIDEGIIRTFIFNTKGSREKAKRKLDNYYKHRGLAPELIQNRKEALENNTDFWSIHRHAIIPTLYDGKRITVIQFTNPEPSSFTAEEFFRNIYMVNDIRVTYDYFYSDIWVVDLKPFTIGHLLRMNPIVSHKAAQIFQDGLGSKIHAIYLVNFPSIGEQVINLFKKIVKAKIMDRLVVQNSLEELHKVLPKQYLPKDYGGEQPSMQEFKDMFRKELQDETTRNFLINACKQVSNEKKRPGNENNEDYVEGTFKQLVID